MRKVLSCFLINVTFLVSSCISLEENKIKNVQAEITAINPTDNYIAVKVAGENLEMHINGNTRITKGRSEIKFSELSVRDKVDISYVKRFGLWEFGETYEAKTIKVLE